MTDGIRELEERLSRLESPSRDRVDTLNHLAWQMVFHDPSRTAELAREATEMARALDYPRGIAWGILNGAYSDYFAADYEPALEKGREALAIFQELSDLEGEASVHNGAGLVHWSLGDFERAVSSLHRGIEIFRDLGMGDREAFGLTSLAGVYENIGDLQKALDGHRRAIDLFRAAGNRIGEARALNGLGAVYQRQGLYEKALEHHLLGLQLSREFGNPVSVSRAMNDVGTTYQAMGDLARAEQFLEAALEQRKAAKNRPAEITSLLDLGKLAIDKGEMERALELLKRALDLATKAGTKPKIFRAHEALSSAYEAVGDFRNALDHYRRFQSVKEEVLGDETATRLRNLQVELESENLERLNRARAKLIQSARMATIGRLVAGIAHEMNTPVGVIQASADVAERAVSKLEREMEDNGSRAGKKPLRAILETLTSHRSTLARASERLTDIVSSLKRLSNLDQAERQLADIHENLETIVSLLLPQWKGRIRVVKEFGTLPAFDGYHADLNQAFLTLLVNAGDAIEGEGTIKIETESRDGRVLLKTSDTGRGIPEELLPGIFDIGFTRRGPRIGLHVGLAHVKATVEKHGGEIEVQSSPSNGTTFSISLPLRNRA